MLLVTLFKSREQTSSPSSKHSDYKKTSFLKHLQHLQLPSHSHLTNMLNFNSVVSCLQWELHLLYLKPFTLNQRFGWSPGWSLNAGLIVYENRLINVK